jgi:LmbE family N-acetylglucosaminyl deacetylase
MNNKIQNILWEMSTVSTTAAKLAAGLGVDLVSVSAGAAERTREELLAEIQKLQTQVSALQASVHSLMLPEDNMSDEDAEDFRAAIVASIRASSMSFLLFNYDSDFFRREAKMPRVRKIVASALCDECARREIQPPDLWVSVAASGLIYKGANA